MTTGLITKPLLDWLLAQHPDTPKKRAKQWIQAGRVSVNGQVIRQPHHPLPDPGSTLALLSRHASAVEGWRIHPRVEILYLDTALAVVNKGPGLLSVPAPNVELSVLSILADFLSGKLKLRHVVPPTFSQLRPRPVHRIDQYTSGVFCLATSALARTLLIAQLKMHTMQREYIAYVEGRPAQPTGTWRHWLKLSGDEMRQFVVRAQEPEATEAITHYEVVAEFPRAGVTKLRLRLETGRKHQIRAQAAEVGLPLVGDRTYNRHPRIEFDRQALHAATLTLDYPDHSGRRLTWTANLPGDLSQLEAALHANRVKPCRVPATPPPPARSPHRTARPPAPNSSPPGSVRRSRPATPGSPSRPDRADRRSRGFPTRR
jgi:23S rRNA pseudouridine1911/1915/1917 synthase